MPSRKASSQGLLKIKSAIARKGWKVTSDRPLLAASQILEPDKSWSELEVYAYGCSRQTWERFLQGVAIRDRSFDAFCRVLDLDPAAVMYSVSNLRVDWGNAPAIDSFYGREAELVTLQKWTVKKRCRLMGIVGFAGIGKTDLALHLTRRIKGEFECLIWRSLLNAPTLETLLGELIEFVADGKEGELATTVDGLISQLLEYLKQGRCLLVLDNVESILDNSKDGENYLENYPKYGDLFRAIANNKHQSCLLFTSRVKPKDIKAEQFNSILNLKGLSVETGKNIFTDIAKTYDSSFKSTNKDWQRLISFYEGNPLALEVTARHILRRFNGNVTEFLQQELRVFGKIRDLLDWHFIRLNPDEQTVMYWLALNREAVSLAELKADIFSPLTKKFLPEILDTLEKQIPLEKTSHGYTLQPVLMEYMSDLIIIQICEELRSGKLQLFNTHALIKAGIKDYIKQSQIRIILQPIIAQLNSEIGYECDRSLEYFLSQLLKNINRKRPGYAGGNLINLMRYAGISLAGYDFSDLTIWQADLQDCNLQRVNFAGCKFIGCSLTQDFGGIHAIALSPDGELLAGGDSQGIIQLYRVRDRQQLLSLQGHVANTWISSLAFSPNNKLLASGSLDHDLKIWDVSTGECLQTFKGHQQWIWSVAFSPDGRLIASGSDDDTVRVWNLATGECQVLASDKRIWAVAFNLEGILASGGFDRTIRLWDVATGKCLKILRGHQAAVWAIAFHPNQGILASSSADKTIKLWDVETGKCLHTLRGHIREVRSIAFSKGDRLVSGSFDCTVRLWNTVTGNLLKTLTGHADRIWAVAANPKTNIIASGDKSQIIKLWSSSSGKCLKTIQGYANWIWAIAVSPNGRLLASGGLDKVVRLWNRETVTVTATLKGHQNMIWSVKFSPDGQLLASCGDDASIKLWDATTGECLHTLPDPTQRGIWTLQFSPDGQFLISGGTNGLIQIWDVSTGNLIRSIEAHDAWVWAITFSPDNKHLASCSEDRTIKLWDINTGSCLAGIEDNLGDVMSIAFSPNSQMLVSGDEDSQLKLWDLETGKCLQNFSGHTDSVWGIAFANRRIFASASADQTIRLWDISTRKCLRVLTGHTAWVRAIAFTPDNKRLISSSTDGTIRIWNLATGETIKVLRPERPYEGMNIQGVKGLTTSQQKALVALGAKQ
ncbi:MAG: NB-ARC domain-containing protein [Pleurocapsa sp. MO_192.B19]|nr:NB-ARC domain-containing protein [Pleurocapsa sp. MO_192.B19]